jgi:dTDP-4-dehydrorhamnose 3,5-epimerase
VKIQPTELPGVLLLDPDVHEDERGFFLETYNAARFAALGVPATFVQDNHSGSRQGVLRGLHYQIRHPQGKLVRVVRGEVFDVAVDLRRSSAAFGCWAGAPLSDDNRRQVWVPPGFAHGFYVLSEFADVLYKVTEIYDPASERTLLWNDPRLGIDWPLVDGRLGWAREILGCDPRAQEHRVREIQPARHSDFPTPAERPAYSVLDCQRAEEAFGVRLPPWREALRLAMSESS